MSSDYEKWFEIIVNGKPKETRVTDQTIEQEIQAKGLTAPRVTPARIDEVCSKPPLFHVFPGSQMTVCCLELANGFTVTGESACASPENFNQELGEKIALQNAKQKVWALEGYLLKQRLSDTSDR
jgi:hypothetical protein